MSRIQTWENSVLAKAELVILANTNSYQERMTLLELVAAEKSNANIQEYWKTLGIYPVIQDAAVGCVNELGLIIEKSELPFSLAISALSREPLTLEQQKKDGVFYTDFRLATMMASASVNSLHEEITVADLAAGTGILLVAVAEEYKKKFNHCIDNWISKCVYAYDLSNNALRGACAAFLSLTNNIASLQKMHENWKTCDSLFDDELSSCKFDIIIGNPPWGKVKLTRHHFLRTRGDQRNYGEDYEDFDSESYENERTQLQEYSKLIRDSFRNVGSSEPDMYMAFLQRSLDLLKEDGQLIYLVPAGLIRSQGTQSLREQLFEETHEIEFHVLDNKKRYFSIDTRFKFVLLTCKNGRDEKFNKKTFLLEITQNEKSSTPVSFDVEQLRQERPDLTIPEVRTEEEKKLLDKIYRNGRSWGFTNDEWKVDILREVDMTNDRKLFSSRQDAIQFPVVEGRMVQQHRFGTKAYISGRGRSARWEPCAEGCHAQYYIDDGKLPEKLKSRGREMRAGYCDIAGQTNERAMMSAIIPAGVVCGNKVPTVIFPNDDTGDMLYLWVGITNSFVFDWMIRRIISTTVNYFLLFSVPVPAISLESQFAKTIIDCTKKLSTMNSEFYTGTEMMKLRVSIDVAVAKAYGINTKEMALILEDFPLIDRGQPILDSASNISITKDLLINMMTSEDNYDLLFKKYEALGAKAYIPAEMVKLTQKGDVCHE